MYSLSFAKNHRSTHNNYLIYQDTIIIVALCYTRTIRKHRKVYTRLIKIKNNLNFTLNSHYVSKNKF